MLSPRLNDATADEFGKYEEQSFFLKLYDSDGEIDIIVAPNLTGLKPRVFKFAGGTLFIEHQDEVIAKKLLYRGEELKPRDVFDVATWLMSASQTEKEIILRIIGHKVSSIKDSFNTWGGNINFSNINTKILIEENIALDLFRDFLVYGCRLVAESPKASPQCVF